MKTQANLLFLALLTSCAKLADGAGDRSSSPATPEVRRLASEPIAVRNAFHYAQQDRAGYAIVRIETVQPIPGGYYRMEADPEGHIARLEGGSEVTATVLTSNQPTLNQQRTLTFRLPGTATCGQREDDPNTTTCFELTYYPPQLHAGETWLVGTVPHTGINMGFHMLLAGRQMASTEGHQEVLRDAVAFPMTE
ncbi:MAG: hypothetical protein EPO40_09315 [Myxococcaceae bacterium]|nr:MAG: hypothetical protein EPO40_09315 [Myxococcaceae bacterium]